MAELAHPARIRDLLLTKTAGRSDELQAWPRLCILPIWSLTKCRLQTNSRSPRRPRRAGDAAGCVVPARRVAGHGRLPRVDRRDRRHALVRQKGPCRIRRNRICGFTGKGHRGHPMNPYPYGTSCPVSMHLALFAVNLALYGFGVLVSLKLAQDCTVRGQSLPGVTNDCDRALRRRTGLSVRRYPLDRQAIQECGRTLKVG